MTVVLWHIELSHYNEKARWALDYKGITHELRTPLPGLHRARALALTRGKHQRLPILDLDGRRIPDSTAIIAALEDYRPEPRLYPLDPDQRRAALELEDWFDEELGPRVRRLGFHYMLRDADRTVETVMPTAGPARKRLMRLMLPIAKPAVRRDYGIDDAAAEEALQGIHRAMDRVEELLGEGDYLVGQEFSVADLTGAALFTPLVAPPQRPYAPQTVPPPLRAVREELSARPGGQWVTEMYARHRGRRAAAAEAA